MVSIGDQPSHRTRRSGLLRYTDLIGPAGYLADVSRGYLVGDAMPTPLQRRLYDDAETFLEEIRTALRPGAAFDELGERLSQRFRQRYRAQRYPFIAHSSGLSDEYPTINVRQPPPRGGDERNGLQHRGLRRRRGRSRGFEARRAGLGHARRRRTVEPCS